MNPSTRTTDAPPPRLAPALTVGLSMASVLAAPTVAQAPSRPAVLPGEPWIVYQAPTANGTSPLRLVRPDGSDDHRLLDIDPLIPDTAHPDWSPDGDRIAFDVWTPRPAGPLRLTIWTVRADGSDAREVATCHPPCLQLSYPAWSPDGRSLALMRFDIRPNGDWGPSAVEVLDLDTGERRPVATTADGTSAYYDLRWSPDGSSLVATMETYADEAQDTILGSSIVILDVPGSGTTSPVVITPVGLPATQPDWGPDDTIVFVTSSRLGGWAGDASLMLVQADGTGLRALETSGSGTSHEPTWADGRIMFTTADAAGPHVASIEPDGSGLSVSDWSFRNTTGEVRRTWARPRPTP
jgi:Tol biopolymer transport system component